MNKAPRIPKTVKYKEESAKATQSKAELFSSFFHSVFAPKTPFIVNRYQNQKAKLQNFKVSAGIIENFLDEPDIKKSRGPNNLPPIFFKVTNVSNVKHHVRNIQAYPETTFVLENSGRSTSVQKGHSQNYRPISVLCIESKIFKKCTYVPQYNILKNLLSKNQHGFVGKRSVMSNLLQFLTEKMSPWTMIQLLKSLHFTVTFPKHLTPIPTNCSSLNYVVSA